MVYLHSDPEFRPTRLHNHCPHHKPSYLIYTPIQKKPRFITLHGNIKINVILQCNERYKDQLDVSFGII